MFTLEPRRRASAALRSKRQAARNFTRTAAGLSLLELMVAIGLSALLTAALLTEIRTFQHSSERLNHALERDENLRLAPLLLARYLTSAGNGRWGKAWEGVVAGDAMLRVRADVDGAGGFPDGELNGRFEDLRLGQSRSDLRLRSGGGTFQPILTQISGWRVRRPAPTLLAITVEGNSRSLPGRPGVDREVLHIDYFLPNYRPSLFPQEVP